MFGFGWWMIQNDQKEGKNTFFTINMNLNLEQRIQNTDAIHSLEQFFLFECFRCWNDVWRTRCYSWPRFWPLNSINWLIATDRQDENFSWQFGGSHWRKPNFTAFAYESIEIQIKHSKNERKFECKPNWLMQRKTPMKGHFFNFKTNDE